MRPDVRHDFDWGRQYIPAIKQILANYLIVEAPLSEDMRHNTDLIVLEAPGIRTACRMRRAAEYLHTYGHQFTIRTDRPNGTKTELAKVLEGWGDYIFYGFGTDSGDIPAWVLGDLNVFRLWHHRYLATNGGQLPGEECHNWDGTKFRAYNIGDLPGEFVVARKTHDDPLSPSALLNLFGEGA